MPVCVVEDEHRFEAVGLDAVGERSDEFGHRHGCRMQPFAPGSSEFFVYDIVEIDTGAFVGKHKAAVGQHFGRLIGQIGVNNRFKKRFHYGA